MAAFTTKSLTQNQSSPFTPPNHRSKMASGRYNARHVRTIDSNIVLSTLGSIHHDSTMSVDQEIGDIDDTHDDIHLPLGMDLGSLSTAIGGDDGEPLPDDSSLAPSQTSRHPVPPIPVYRALEMGFRPSKAPSVSDAVRGIRVDVEKATATM
jgi:hypothetical protein